MESRLRQLQLQMLEEKQKREREKPMKHGGNRWRSAREDRGSVAHYAKDIITSNVGRSKSAVKPVSSDIKQKTPAQVLEWLTSIGLDEYHSAFEFHQVTGGVLLELTLDEYVQIGVSKLSARNLLLVEAASKAKGRDKHRATGQKPVPVDIIDPKLHNAPPGPEVPSPTERRVHWSHVTPIADNPVRDGDGQVPINLADGEFDEDASHATFLKALLDWRGTDGDGAGADDKFWTNPMATGGGGKLLEGSYDEENEHIAFQRAVAAWRNGGVNQGLPSATEIITERSEQSCATSQRRSCWQCYRLVAADEVVRDTAVTKKEFCSDRCLDCYQQEYAHLYPKE
ncbi:TPA: hypothetical protein N0F65_006866 [Lagenidium giganteum]|uniref:SAM domain-containing protein n=1 Tax=Lagenidium giganteum TaxID=4803 RepID=A0AAV2ZJS5_9STRA|nr:TPA: hypothetical protein N0F65_006866 [Lagenidium giganteum]